MILRDQSKRIVGTLENFDARMAAAIRSQAEYDRHVAPIVAWARAEAGSSRAAWELLRELRYDDATSDTAFRLLGQAMIVLKCARE